MSFFTRNSASDRRSPETSKSPKVEKISKLRERVKVEERRGVDFRLIDTLDPCYIVVHPGIRDVEPTNTHQAVVIIGTKDRMVFLISKSEGREGKWEYIAGGIKTSEVPTDAAKRVMQERAGFDIKEKHFKKVFTLVTHTTPMYAAYIYVLDGDLLKNQPNSRVIENSNYSDLVKITKGLDPKTASEWSNSFTSVMLKIGIFYIQPHAVSRESRVSCQVSPDFYFNHLDQCAVDTHFIYSRDYTLCSIDYRNVTDLMEPFTQADKRESPQAQSRELQSYETPRTKVDVEEGNEPNIFQREFYKSPQFETRGRIYPDLNESEVSLASWDSEQKKAGKPNTMRNKPEPTKSSKGKVDPHKLVVFD